MLSCPELGSNECSVMPLLRLNANTVQKHSIVSCDGCTFIVQFDHWLLLLL